MNIGNIVRTGVREILSWEPKKKSKQNEGSVPEAKSAEPSKVLEKETVA